MDKGFAGVRVKDGNKVPCTVDSLTRRGTPNIKPMVPATTFAHGLRSAICFAFAAAVFFE
jgi:hypothetical protein